MSYLLCVHFNMSDFSNSDIVGSESSESFVGSELEEECLDFPPGPT